MDSLNLGSMNVVDILILVIFLLNVIIGLSRGLLSEILSLVILIAAFIVAIMFTGQLAGYFTSTNAMQNVVSGTNDTAAQSASYMILAVSFGILFIATIIIGGVIKLLLNMMVSATGLGFGNRILGSLFGFVRGYLVNFALIFLVQLSPLSKSEAWQKSTLVPKFQPQVAWLANIVSPTLTNIKETFKTTIEKNAEKIEESTGGVLKVPTTDTNKETAEPSTTTTSTTVPVIDQTN